MRDGLLDTDRVLRTVVHMESTYSPRYANPANERAQALDSMIAHLSAGDAYWLALMQSLGVDETSALLLKHGGVNEARISDIVGDAFDTQIMRSTVRASEEAGEVIEGLRRARKLA